MIKILPTGFNTKYQNNKRYLNIKYSGYITLSSIGLCCLTGVKQIKIPQKAKIHKYSAIITGISSLWHIAAIKRWDRLFTKNK